MQDVIHICDICQKAKARVRWQDHQPQPSLREGWHALIVMSEERVLPPELDGLADAARDQPAPVQSLVGAELEARCTEFRTSVDVCPRCWKRHFAPLAKLVAERLRARQEVEPAPAELDPGFLRPIK